MKLYLSSYKVGNETARLKQLVPIGRIAYIPNALDFTGADPVRRAKHIETDMSALCDLGFQVDLVDLRDYFDKHDVLERKIEKLGAIFISGGNVFVLRQAMKLSGLDEVLEGLRDRSDFLYAGYSAAGCVLAPSLRAYAIVDKVDTPYGAIDEVIRSPWPGLCPLEGLMHVSAAGG